MVRAKFRVSHLRRNDWGTDLSMTPVFSDDPNHENKKFWDATPGGELRMTIKNEAAASHFELGKEYYLDFTKAE